MKKFLRKILVFSVIIILILVAGETAVRDTAVSYSYKDKWLERHGANVSELILGSSHTYYGVRPDLLGDSAFNLANISQTPEYDYALLKHYAAKMPNLRRIILPISYFTFRDPKLEEMSRSLAINYKIGMNLPLHSDFSIYNFTISDFDGYRGRLENLFFKKHINVCDSLGFGLGMNIEDRSENWEEKGEKRADDVTLERGSRPEEVVECIENLVRYCKARGIECIFVTTPTWHTFRQHMDKQQFDEMRNLSSKLIRKYNLRYFNRFVSDEYVNEDFHDTDHLSDIGAIKFTKELRAFIDSGCLDSQR